MSWNLVLAECMAGRWRHQTGQTGVKRRWLSIRGALLYLLLLIALSDQEHLSHLAAGDLTDGLQTQGRGDFPGGGEGLLAL